jgi:hypothetical protein
MMVQLQAWVQELHDSLQAQQIGRKLLVNRTRRGVQGPVPQLDDLQ